MIFLRVQIFIENVPCCVYFTRKLIMIPQCSQTVKTEPWLTDKDTGFRYRYLITNHRIM